MRKINISPSLMGMDLLEVKKQIEYLNTKAYSYHVDILDWHYAKNLCFSFDFISQLRTITDVPIEVHLMVEGTDTDVITAVIDAGADIVSMQADEISKNVFDHIETITEKGCKVGIVLNPAVSLDAVALYLDKVDVLTFMGVTPGYAGRKLNDCVLDKIRDAVKWREEKHYHYEIEIDGGCNLKTLPRILDSGIDSIIVGKTLLFGQDEDITIAWEKMEKIFTETADEKKDCICQNIVY